MLPYLQDNDELFNTELIDSVVTAKIPDENLYPELYKLGKQHMIHGPCGYQNLNSPCMRLKFVRVDYRAKARFTCGP